MKSSKLAAIAGVTVRTLRHYHQIGVLDEPKRGDNGYRSYTVHDLIRVLRIKNLTELGVSLSKVADVLDTSNHEYTQTLDDLEHELDLQIRRLKEKKKLIAQLRTHRSPLDTPSALIPFLNPSIVSYGSMSIEKLDREQSILLTHLAGKTGEKQLVQLYEQMAAPEVAPELQELSRRLDTIAAEDNHETIERLADDIVSQVMPVLQTLDVSSNLSVDDKDFSLHDEYLKSTLNSAQLEVIRKASEKLEKILGLKQA